MGLLRKLAGFGAREAVAESISGESRQDLCVYVIGFEDPRFDGIVKIGVTNNVARRIATLQTGCPWRLEVKAMTYRPDAYHYENALHEHFAEFRMREDGEWFKFPKEYDPVMKIASASA